MSNTFVTTQELQELTGYKYQKHQLEWLKQRNWKYETDCTGKPRVLRSYFESRLGGTSRAKSAGPNWAAIETT